MEPTSPQAPRVLGRYALYDPIAAGGMATVHLGRLLGHVGFERTVAIKRLHPQFSRDPEFVAMFLDEARVVARIRHPNVIPTLDVVAVDGELFIVMEYVQGESLARLIRAAVGQGARVPPAYVATMLAGVLHGLHAAHEAKSERGEPLDVVHRDISPQNVLVGTDGVARVLDFGVAKAAGRIQTTRDGQLKGKLAYMAPEQISGTVGRFTDVYAASVVLWEALTGRRLFAGDSDAHVMKLVLEGRVGPPSAHVADLPAALDALTLRGLSREPGDRFATARDMALALEDAVTLVAPSKIGAWVEATASKTLLERSARIAAIESSSSIDIRPPVAAALAAAPAVTTLAPEDLHTELSSGSSSSPRASARTAPESPRRRFVVVALVGGAIVAAAAVGLYGRGGASVTKTVAAEIPAPPSAPDPPASALPVAPAPEASASTASTPPPPSSASAAPAPSPAAPRAPLRALQVPAQRPPHPLRIGDGTADRK